MRQKWMMLVPLLVFLMPAADTQAAQLSETEKAQMALQRLGFGPRPGEIERVSEMGVQRWIDLQLQPEKISDKAVQEKTVGLTVPKQTAAQLYASYPNPAAISRLVAAKQNRAGAGNGQQMMSAENVDRDELRKQIAQIYRQEKYQRPQEIFSQLVADRILRATYSERQLQEVMVDFWSNHFNVYARKNTSLWMLPSYDREVIRPHAMGNFRDLLFATAQSPSMLFYLDNVESVAPQTNTAANKGQRDLSSVSDEQLKRGLMKRRGMSAEQAEQQIKRLRANTSQVNNRQRDRGINENYARELMELHTLGVDGGYTQQDIREVARAFTGWTVSDPRGLRAFAQTSGNDMYQQAMQRMERNNGEASNIPSGAFYFNARMHDAASKQVLGKIINVGGMQDGAAVIDLLANHPSTAKHIAQKLAVRFANDNPDPAMVDRVAKAFTQSKGDIRSTLRALFNDPLFFTEKNQNAKIKTPFELMISSLRALDAQTNGREIQSLLNDLGEPLYGYQAPTGYPDMAEDWVNSGALLKRMNFAVAISSNRIPGTEVDLNAWLKTASPLQQMDAGIQRLLGNQISASTKTALVNQLNHPLPEVMLGDSETQDMVGDGERLLARGQNQRMRLLEPQGDPNHIKVVSLLLGSPDFQRQ